MQHVVYMRGWPQFAVMLPGDPAAAARRYGWHPMEPKAAFRQWAAAHGLGDFVIEGRLDGFDHANDNLAEGEDPFVNGRVRFANQADAIFFKCALDNWHDPRTF